MIPRRKRSGGPQTPQGKLTAATNAIKSGAYAALIILPGENEAEYQQLEQQFTKDFSPQDIAEGAIVHELVVITWKKLRLEKIEHAALLRAMAAPFTTAEIARTHCAKRISDHPSLLDHVEAYTPEAAEEFETLQAKAEELQAKTNITIQDLDKLQKSSHPLFEHLAEVAQADGIDPDDPSVWLQASTLHADGTQLPFIQVALQYIIDHAEIVAWAGDHQDQIRATAQQIKEARLLPMLLNTNQQRVHDDLSRAFYRSLAELRRHQQWRRQLSTVILDPAQDQLADEGDDAEPEPMPNGPSKSKSKRSAV